jgi:hypothetical protein
MAMATSKPKPRISGKPALPLTRKWIDDYKRWSREGCPTPEQEAARATAPGEPETFTQWPERNPAPDLQELVERAGRRHAALIGEAYDENPFTRPAHQGGYAHITPEEWVEFDRQKAEWEARRRDYMWRL